MTDLTSLSEAPVVTWPHAVVCGVDGTPAGREALRQAAALVAPGGRLVLHTVTHGDSSGLTALAEAEVMARAIGVDADLRATRAATTAGGLVDAAQGADLLVIGCDTVGPTPSAVLRQAPGSVLLARPPSDLSLLDTLLVDAKAPPRVQELAARLAHEHGGELRSVPRSQLAVVATATGCGLIVIGDVPDAIPLAQAAPCSVLVASDPR